MIEKVLGFKEKDIIDYGALTIEVRKDKLVPVVSLKEHQKFLDVGKQLKLRVIELELELKKTISLEWLERERDKIREYNSNQKEKSDFMRGWLAGSSDSADALFKAAKIQSGEK